MRCNPRIDMKRALQIILLFGLAGLAFSGYLTYRELFGTFGTPPASCPLVGQPGTVLGAPACVYGFFMYLTIVALAALGLVRARAGS